MLKYIVKLGTENINWEQVCNVKERAGLATHPIEATKRAFENSYISLFILDDDEIIGTGRVISDGVYQAGIYDIAVLPEYQGKGIGKLIMDELHKRLDGFNIILYANPTAEKFYKKLGYSKMLTGMARFKNEESMRKRGFIE